jgi:hypothetical protein
MKVETVAAIATTVSAVVIAWQAYETRRAAGAARQGLDLSRASLAAADEALDVSRESVLAMIRGRLEDRAALISVLAAPTNTEAVLHEARTMGESPAPWPGDTEFRRNGDDYMRLMLGAQFEVTNHGSRSVQIWLDGPITILRSPVAEPGFRARKIVTLTPGEKVEFRVEEAHPLVHWVERWESRARGEAVENDIVAQVQVDDGFDEGMIDRWDLVVSAHPVRPKPADVAAWVLRNHEQDPPLVTSAVMPMVRSYYRSKASNEPLPITAIRSGIPNSP